MSKVQRTTRLLNQENRSPDSPWREPQERVFPRQKVKPSRLSADRALAASEFQRSGAGVLKLVRLPPSLAATLAALPSISEIPFLDSRVPAFLI